jgi:arsenate reductase
MKRVIFACVQNAGRSQMARAFFDAIADPVKVQATSAGTRPGAAVHPEVVDALREAGIEIAGVKPQRLTVELAEGADLIVTMGCGDDCPVVPGSRRIDWPLQDPKGQDPYVVRQIRDEIRRRVEVLVQSEGWTRSDPPART